MYNSNALLLQEWHPVKNLSLSPDKISRGSHKKIWWLCSKNISHEWLAFYKDRAIKATGCPFCAGRKVDSFNCLKTTHPDIAKEWHPIKNLTLSSDNIMPGNKEKVWWLCSKDPSHEWQATCNNRTSKNKSGCPFCSGRKKIN